MFNLWQANSLQSYFRQILLVLSGLLALSSCDRTRGQLASVAVSKTFSQWVWQGDHFESVATEEGLLGFKDKPDLSTISSQETLLFSVNGKGEVLWWAGGKNLYTFPFWNPSGAFPLNNQALNFLLEHKKPIQLLNAYNRFWIVLSSLKSEEPDSATGISLLSIDNEKRDVSPKVLPFQLEFPEANLLGMEREEEGFITFWERESKKLALFYDESTGQERSLSKAELKDIFPTVSYLTLSSSARRLFDQVANDQEMKSFLIRGNDTESGKTIFYRIGDPAGDLPIIGSSQESLNYWVVLTGNQLYSLSKQTGIVSRLDLPLQGFSIRYTNFLLGREGYLVLWRLSVQTNQDIVGLMHLPYAR